jgi:hypothetical protein
MVTVHRAHGFRFVIFTNDHSPPHVHVFGADGAAKITLDGPQAPELDWVVGIGRADVRRIMQEAWQQHVYLLAEWRRIHG